MVGHIADLSHALSISLPRLAILGPDREAALVALLGQPAQPAQPAQRVPPVVADNITEDPSRGGAAGSIDRIEGPAS